MSRYSILLILTLSVSLSAFSQRQMRRLSFTINKPSWNASNPSISGDGNTLIFLTDYTDNPGLSMFWSKKNGAQWDEPKEINRLVNRPDMTLEGAFSLDFEGNTVLITSRKYGIGGFDIWYSELKNGDWTQVQNFGKPINTTGDEGAAVLTPDGNGMYFMRCDVIQELNASGCKLYYAEKKYDKWQEPEILPENINRYDPQMPKILADEETLIFASNTAGGKGGYDLYLTRKNENGWDDPVNLEFANTENDDMFISVAAKGRYLMRHQMGDHRVTEIVELLFPDEFKPKGVYRIAGTIKDASGQPVDAVIQLFDIDKRKRLINEKTKPDGSFALVMEEGDDYDLSIVPADGSLQYYSEVYQLEEIPSRDRETLNITALSFAFNQPVVNDLLVFKDGVSELKEISTFEVRRVSNLLRDNPSWNIKLTTYLNDYREDTIASDPDLTEVRYDTSYSYIKTIVPADHIMTSIDSTLNIEDILNQDQLLTNDIDTLMLQHKTDSLYLTSSTDSVVVPVLERNIKSYYHNDRTLQDSEFIKELLVEQGVAPERIIIEGVVKKPHEDTEISKWVEIIWVN